MEIKMKATVDTKEIDRLCIGGRLYDALQYKHGDCINFHSIIEYDYKTGTVRISEADLLDLLKLVNRHSKAEHIEIIRATV